MKQIIKNKKVYRIVITIAFLLSFYWVEFSSWGSSEVEKHNDGYGTFDMKSYDAEIVARQLECMPPDLLESYNKYYFADFGFVLFFGMFQCMISGMLFSKNGNLWERAVRIIMICVSIGRGVFDCIENSLLMITIKSYQTVHTDFIQTASVSTQSKLWCIRIWAAFFAAGFIYRIVTARLNKKSNLEKYTDGDGNSR